jgi:hypothetical protein
MPDRRIQVPPADPDAEPICTLDREMAMARQEPPDKFLDEAASQKPITSGIEYMFNRVDGLWERAETFVKEEAECCPFLAFEIAEQGDTLVLRVTQP